MPRRYRPRTFSAESLAVLCLAGILAAGLAGFLTIGWWASWLFSVLGTP